MEAICERCKVNPVSCTAVGIQVCAACRDVLFDPDLQTNDVPPDRSGWRYCSRCKVPIYNTYARCQNCGYVEMILCDDPENQIDIQPSSTPVNTPANPCWKCMCGYEYNLRETCGKCNRQKPGNQGASSTAPSTYWTCSQCSYEYNTSNTCSKCPPQNKQYQPPAYAYPSMTQYWVCTCGYQFNSGGSCENCGSFYQNPVSPSPPQPQLQVLSWNCSNCRQIYSESQTICLSCNIPKPSVIEYPSISQYHDAGVAEVRQDYPQLYPSVRSEPQNWKCLYCLCDHNTVNTPKCVMCKQDRADWLCWACGWGHLNQYSQCVYCRKSRNWEEYLTEMGVELSADRKSWKCEKCNQMVSMTVDTCQQCQTINIEIVNGQKHEGNRRRGWNCLERVLGTKLFKKGYEIMY